MSAADDVMPDSAQDLLFAALNQSGLTAFDSPLSTYSDEADPAEDPLASLGLLPPPATVAVGRATATTSAAAPIPTLQATQKSLLSQVSTAATSNAEQKPRNLITVTKQGSKIIKLPLPGTGAVAGPKPNIIRVPLNLTSNGVSRPILIRKAAPGTPQVTTPRIITIGKSTPATSSAKPNPPLPTTSSATASSLDSRSLVIDPNNPQKATYAKVTVGNKRILIPVTRKAAPPSRVIVPVSNARPAKVTLSSVKPLVLDSVSLPTTAKNSSASARATPPTISLAVSRKLSAPAKPGPGTTSGLNLGSLFVESAEKEVEVPKQTRIPIVKPLVSDKNNNSSVVNKVLITSTPPSQVLYDRNCASPFSPVSDILSSLTNMRPQSPLVSEIGAEVHVNGRSMSPLAVDGMRTSKKLEQLLMRQNTVSGTGKVDAERDMKPPISRSHSVAHFYKNSKTRSTKDFSIMDMQGGLQTKKTTDELVEDEERQEEETQHASTYAEYKPSKLNIGLPHPDSVVETSSLSSVPPPDIQYTLSIPEETIDYGHLSALQLETITYACQKHSTFLPSGERAGFLIGDGAGVGKGRTIAGIIFENYLLGRKRALWFSVSNDLRFDSERDLRDIGAKSVHVHVLNKFKYGKISSKENNFVKKGVIFATYSSLIGESHTDSKYGTRLKQILHWCGKDFDGVIVFDECHKAKNLIPSGSAKPTKTGYTVLELQKRLPLARVIYASATGASEPRNMAYMSRIGLWGAGTPFCDFTDFIQAVERRGVGAMEMVAMDLKSRGAYIARQLSFHGVSFKITEVALTSSFIKMYNAAVKLWVAAREAFQISATLIDAEHNMKKTMWGQFWAAHQRFFKYLCIAAKVDYASRLAREAVKHGKCVVIGLQSTGEARTLDQLEKCGGELDDFVSTAKGVFENLIENHFPAPNRKRVTDLFGKDFYKKDDSDDDTNIGGAVAGKKRARVNKNKDDQPASKRFHSAKASESDAESSDDGGTFSDDDEKESKMAGFCSDASLDFSDEDIGKIFGGGSDSDEWGGDSEVTKKKKLKKMKKPKRPDMDEEADRMLEEAGLKVAKVTPAADIKPEKTSLASLATNDAGDSKGNGLVSLSLTGLDPVDRAQALKQELLEKLESLSLPNNTLDELIDALGGPENVAEMTGRKGRVVATEQGNIQYESRTENDIHCDMLNLAEKQRFMDGEKNIAIISEAASSGISLQSDRRARNQRRRLHITLELPWSADRAIQQFGRTHRSNQVNAPEYVFLISELAGEQRFASVVAKRLESLGALTHGDRRATETRDLSQYNFDNKFGRLALESIMKAIAGLDVPLVHPPETYPGLFFRDIRAAMIGVGLVAMDGPVQQPQLEKEYNNIVKFMNRILGMEVMQQNAVFQFFSDTLSSIVQKAKSQGQFDQGIMDVGSGEDCVERVDCRRFLLKHDQQNGEAHHTGSGYVELHTVRIERGMSWKDAEEAWSQMCTGDSDGFYLTHLKRNGKCMAVLCVEGRQKALKYQQLTEEEKLPDNVRMFAVHRPNSGKQVKRESLTALKARYRKARPDEARTWWEKQYKASVDTCSHAFWQAYCTRQMHGVQCAIGKRRRTYHVLSGSVLAVWRLVERALSVGTPALYKMQIVRLKTEDGGKLVGLLIPSNCVSDLVKLLSNPFDLLKPHVKDDVQSIKNANHALSRTVSTPVFTIEDDDEDVESDGSFEEVDDDAVEDEKFSPDEVVSSVLFPNSKKYSWMS